MMKDKVVIKSTKNGMILRLDPDADFNTLSELIEKKFKAAAAFFGSAEMILSLEGRELSGEEMDIIHEIISRNTEIKIMAVADEEAPDNKIFDKMLKEVYYRLNDRAVSLYKGDVEVGKELRSSESILITGSVMENASVHSDGSVFVLGNVEGAIYAGIMGNTASLVYAGHIKNSDVAIADNFYVYEKTEEKGFLKRRKATEKEYHGVLFRVIDGKVVMENA